MRENLFLLFTEPLPTDQMNKYVPAEFLAQILRLEFSRKRYLKLPASTFREIEGVILDCRKLFTRLKQPRASSWPGRISVENTTSSLLTQVGPLVMLLE